MKTEWLTITDKEAHGRRYELKRATIRGGRNGSYFRYDYRINGEKVDCNAFFRSLNYNREG